MVFYVRSIISEWDPGVNRYIFPSDDSCYGYREVYDEDRKTNHQKYSFHGTVCGGSIYCGCFFAGREA